MAEKEAKEQEAQRSRAKLSQYDALKAKVDMMEQSKSQGDAALNLLDQFMKTGFVTQHDDGSFAIPGINVEKKFKPFDEQGDDFDQ